MWASPWAWGKWMWLKNWTSSTALGSPELPLPYCRSPVLRRPTPSSLHNVLHSLWEPGPQGRMWALCVPVGWTCVCSWFRCSQCLAAGCGWSNGACTWTRSGALNVTLRPSEHHPMSLSPSVHLSFHPFNHLLLLHLSVPPPSISTLPPSSINPSSIH